MHVQGFDNLTPSQRADALAAGSRLVFYEYCVSLVVLTLRCPTRLHLLRAGDRGVLRGLPYALVSLLLGWWGIPWGLVYTPATVFTNLCGGHDVTEEVRAMLTTGPTGEAGELAAQ
jgi:hypothetical protein